MAKRSGSKANERAQFDGMLRNLKGGAAPAMAKALNLDNAEAVEAAMNAGLELMLAARAVVRAMPLPAEAREHLDRAEAETLRAARMAARGLNLRKPKSRQAAAKQVAVDFGTTTKKEDAGKRARRTRK